MKFVSIHPLSALAGAGLLGLMLVSIGAGQAGASVQHLPLKPSRMRIVGIPDPGDRILLKQEDGPFAVPHGKILIITGLGTQEMANNYPVDLLIDGSQVIQAGVSTFNGSTGGIVVASSLQSIDSLPIRAGAIVTLSVGGSPTVLGRATGYLSDARP